MSQASIQKGKNGRVEIHGELSFASVPLLWNDFCSRFPDQGELEVDLRHIQRSDSAGLALLVECLRQAHQRGQEIRFFNIPAQMLAIARVSCLDQVLPLHRD